MEFLLLVCTCFSIVVTIIGINDGAEATHGAEILTTL